MTTGPGARRPRVADSSGMAAGYMIVGSIVLFAALGGLVGLLVGAVVPLALVGAPIGLVIGFYAVWVRFFKQR
jgi:hypothetical protein